MYNSLIPYVLEDGPCAHRVAFLRWCCNGAFSKLFRCSMGLADSGWQHRAFLIPSLLYSCTLCRYDVIQDPVKMAQSLHGGARRSPVRKGKRISNLHVYSCHSESLAQCSQLATNWQLVSSREMCHIGGSALVFIVGMLGIWQWQQLHGLRKEVGHVVEPLFGHHLCLYGHCIHGPAWQHYGGRGCFLSTGQVIWSTSLFLWLLVVNPVWWACTCDIKMFTHCISSHMYIYWLANQTTCYCPCVPNIF